MLQFLIKLVVVTLSQIVCSISVIGHDLKDKLDINQLIKKLANYFGGNDSNYEWVKSFDIKNATIKQNTNFLIRIRFLQQKD